jgi:hypothetical protein
VAAQAARREQEREIERESLKNRRRMLTSGGGDAERSWPVAISPVAGRGSSAADDAAAGFGRGWLEEMGE